MPTRIEYIRDWDQDYDLVAPGHRRELMIHSHITANAPKFGGVEGFRNRLVEERFFLKQRIDPLVDKWYTLDRQIDFLDRVLAGEIVLPPAAPEKVIDVD